MERYESWLDRAKSSFELSKITTNELIYYEDLCFQAQQAVEKALKGLLIYFGDDPDFTHNLGILLATLIKYTEIPEEIEESIKLNNFAVQTRYPGEYEEITKDEYEECIRITGNCLKWVEEIIIADKRKNENDAASGLQNDKVIR
ncbi:HEPN domain-containing protein [Treponema primitia]|uniref:HEPN domain-containing protein n=1 Tax=Treponema primitia TaxID=88058 RepID=UPI00025551F2|nr:HEPN domain-containing protein [Treponema primitia]